VERLVRGWSGKAAVSKPGVGRTRSLGQQLRAFGASKTIAGWLKDRRCRVTRTGIDERIRRGWTVEEAISTPPLGRRGAAKVVR